MNCKFCNTQSINIWESDDNNDTWYSCKICNIEYTSKCSSNMGIIIYKTLLNNKLYEVSVNDDVNKTIIWVCEDPSVITYRQVWIYVKSINSIINNVTPSNISSKLKNYLVFL